MFTLLIQLIVVCLIVSVLWWAVTRIPLPAPASWIVQVVFAVVVALALIALFFGGTGLHESLLR